MRSGPSQRTLAVVRALATVYRPTVRAIGQATGIGASMVNYHLLVAVRHGLVERRPETGGGGFSTAMQWVLTELGRSAIGGPLPPRETWPFGGRFVRAAENDGKRLVFTIDSQVVPDGAGGSDMVKWRSDA